MYDSDGDLIENEMNFENHCLNRMNKMMNEMLIDVDCLNDDFVANDAALCKIRLQIGALKLLVVAVLLFDDEQ